MKKEIRKYQFYSFGLAFKVDLPIGSKILDFQYQDDHIVFWAIVDDDAAESVTRKFRIVGTGDAYDFTNRRHCKTLQDGNENTWHIFEVLD